MGPWPTMPLGAPSDSELRRSLHAAVTWGLLSNARHHARWPLSYLARPTSRRCSTCLDNDTGPQVLDISDTVLRCYGLSSTCRSLPSVWAGRAWRELALHRPRARHRGDVGDCGRRQGLPAGSGTRGRNLVQAEFQDVFVDMAYRVDITACSFLVAASGRVHAV